MIHVIFVLIALSVSELVFNTEYEGKTNCAEDKWWMSMMMSETGKCVENVFFPGEYLMSECFQDEGKVHVKAYTSKDCSGKPENEYDQKFDFECTELMEGADDLGTCNYTMPAVQLSISINLDPKCTMEFTRSVFNPKRCFVGADGSDYGYCTCDDGKIGHMLNYSMPDCSGKPQQTFDFKMDDCVPIPADSFAFGMIFGKRSHIMREILNSNYVYGKMYTPCKE